MNLKAAINSNIMFGKYDLSISNLKEGWWYSFLIVSKVHPLFMQYNNTKFGRVTLKLPN